MDRWFSFLSLVLAINPLFRGHWQYIFENVSPTSRGAWCLAAIEVSRSAMIRAGGRVPCVARRGLCIFRETRWQPVRWMERKGREKMDVEQSQPQLIWHCPQLMSASAPPRGPARGAPGTPVGEGATQCRERPVNCPTLFFLSHPPTGSIHHPSVDHYARPTDTQGPTTSS